MSDLISPGHWKRGYVIAFTQDMLSSVLVRHSTCNQKWSWNFISFQVAGCTQKLEQ